MQRMIYLSAAALILAMISSAKAVEALQEKPPALVAGATVASADPLDLPARLHVEDVPLEVALERLEAEAGVGVAYSPSLLPAGVYVTCACQQATVGEAASIILQGTSFEAAGLAEYVVIRRRPAPATRTASLDLSPEQLTYVASGAARGERDREAARPPVGTITGQVRHGTTNAPVDAAQITIAGTGMGTLTGNNGRYLLTNVPAGTHTVVVERIGYRTVSRETTVADGQTVTVDFELAQQAVALDELVVTGLSSSIERRNLANAVSTVSGEELTGTTNQQSLDGALRGKVPGVNIRALGGAPGGGVNMQFRGISTLGAGSSQPLFIIDGVYVDNSSIGTGRTAMLVGSGTGTNTRNDNVSNRIADLNPEDIESMEILKGPSAAAIYGARANAGVVIITTKRGAAGETRINFKQDFGVTSALKFLGFDDWSEEKIDLIFTDPARNALEKQRFREGQRFDWEEELYGEEGLLSNSQASLSGGSGDTQFFISGGIQHEDGIIKHTGFERKSIRANVDHQLSSRVSIASNSNYIQYDSDRGFTDNGSGASIGYNLANTPNYWDLRPGPDGDYPGNPYFRDNPISVRDRAINNRSVNRFLQGVTLDATLMERGDSRLGLSVQGGLDFLNSESLVYFPDFLQNQQNRENPGDVVHGKQQNLTTNWQAFLSYDFNRGAADFTSQLGLTGQTLDVSNLFVRGQGLAPGQRNMQQAEVQQIFTQFEQSVEDVGVAGQQEVNWDDKIIGTVGLRIDKSTLNSQQNEFYAFPKASLAVNVANFAFWDVSAFDQLKLRAAYGETGGLPQYGQTFEILNGTNIGGNLGSVISNRGVDPDLKPERATELEMGVDVGLWEGSVGLGFTYYRKAVQDLILDLIPPSSSGIAAIATNAADLRNNGFEVTLNAALVQTRDLNWQSQVMFWRNRTTITNLDVPSFTFGGFGLSLGDYLIEEGMSPTTIVGTPADPDPTVYGDAQPDWDMSWNNHVTIFQNLEFTSLLHYQHGGDIINLTRLLMDGGGTSPDWSDDDDGDGIPNGRDRGPAVAGRFIEDATYLKLREVGLYYNLPSSFAGRLFGSERVKVGMSGQNLLMISDYSSYDPEVSVNGVQAIASSVEITPYPSARRLLFHVEVGL